mmetsp:Transcript_6002/g.14908  ORF Transcript_6002/g.14908 Transcript_6002/m.14908 type:complete len:454 (+) Transcript_6002:198-1559(+)
MVSSRNSPLLLLLLDGSVFQGERTTEAFVTQSRREVTRSPDRRQSSNKRKQVVTLNSFSYLEEDGDESGVGMADNYSTATYQQQQNPFPFGSNSFPEPSFDFPVRQEELGGEQYETELYFDESPNDSVYPQYPQPEVVANPYDFTPFRDEEERYIDAIPTRPAPVPRPAGGAIALATDPVVTPAVEVKNIWETDAPQTIQGASLKTWDFNSERLEAVQVLLKTEGRPLKADVELWQGENAPQKISVYSENGDTRPLSAFIATPYNGHTAIAVRNSGEGEFPMKACVEADMYQNGNHLAGGGAGYGNQLAKFTLQQLWDQARPKTVQGDGATYVVPLEANIQRVQILITSEKNPINARIEILEGPNNVKQVLEISTEDGKARPFFCVLDLPDPILTNVMRVVNTGPFEFPIECRIEPFKLEEAIDIDIDEENLYFLMDSGGPGADQTSSPFLLS